MSIFVGFKLILAIVYMEHCYLIYSNNFVELFKHAACIIYNVVTRIVSVAGIKANAKFIIVLYAVINHSKFLKSSTYLGSFAGHSFKRYKNIRIFS